MSVLIGGSGSTGSSLLRRILNRHSSIYCGPETSLFCKKPLYENWNTNKYRILKRGFLGLRNDSWHLYNGTDLYKEESIHSLESVGNLIKNCNDFVSFAEAYFNKPLEYHGKSLWIEKTPANSYHFTNFKSAFNRSKTIHMVRHPYETILSLMGRGFNMYYSCALYLLNTSFGLSQRNSINHLTISYESLVNSSEVTIEECLNFLDLEYESSMFITEDKIYDDDPPIIGEWRSQETDPIALQSSKFDELKIEEQHHLIQAANSIKINSSYAKKFNLSHLTIKSIAKELNYNFTESDDFVNFEKEKLKDQWMRFTRAYPFHFIKYPIDLIH